MDPRVKRKDDRAFHASTGSVRTELTKINPVISDLIGNPAFFSCHFFTKATKNHHPLEPRRYIFVAYAQNIATFRRSNDKFFDGWIPHQVWYDDIHHC